MQAAMPTARISGLEISVTNPISACDSFIDSALSNSQDGKNIVLCNSFTIALARNNKTYFDLLSSIGQILPDGKPLSWAMRTINAQARQVRGPEFFANVLDRGQSKHLRHFLLGGSDETLTALTKSIRAKYANAEIVGSYSPPFRPMTNEEIEAQDAVIARARPNIVWVSLGTPKQDFEAHRISRTLGISSAAVGAAFDFFSGTKREAPSLFTKLGMEWVFRLATEPGRLWKRYLIGNILFILAVAENGRKTKFLNNCLKLDAKRGVK